MVGYEEIIQNLQNGIEARIGDIAHVKGTQTYIGMDRVMNLLQRVAGCGAGAKGIKCRLPG